MEDAPRSEPPSVEPPLVAAALDLYRRDGVPASCLVLQTRSGVDVNLVLFAVVGAARSVPVTPELVAAASARVGAWHSEVVRPLRAVRQRLKSGPDPAPSERTAALRARIQQVEIEAEMVELGELDPLLVPPADGGAAVESDLATRITEAVLLVLREHTGRPPDVEERAAVAHLAAAAGAQLG